MTDNRIIPIDVSSGGASKRGKLSGLPFADLIEPNTGFVVNVGSVSGVYAALKRFCVSETDSTEAAEALYECFRILPADEKEGTPTRVALATYRPDFPESVVMVRKEESKAEAAALSKAIDAANRRGTLAGLKKGLAEFQKRIAELESK